ncbi:MAG TPA: hypothetical protein VK553_05610 [Candidatus Nitrosopolaris rasttigaisensis]|nr:hypothetical protein [Candidatus Nitrosopolaris rasttigaisensis]
MKEYIELLENRPDLQEYENGMGIYLRLKGTPEALFEVVKFIKEYEIRCKVEKHEPGAGRICC